MKITNIRIRAVEDKISLLADCKIRHIGWDTLYFTFDKRYKDFIYQDASPFAAALLVPSMYLGQDLVIEGSISRELYDGMQSIMDKMLEWKVGMHRIQIRAQNIVMDVIDRKPEHVGTFFSGGVDSFYTYLKHQHDKTDPITHLILVNGADIDLRNKKLWEATKENVQSIAGRGNIELIAVETNQQTLLEPMMSPDFTHGGSLAAVGLSLRKRFKKIYIPATFAMNEQVPYGSHPDLDKNWSTEGLLFDHDGLEATRFQKIDWQIAKSPVALEYLRVCYMNVKEKYNCGKCEKCLRTMVGLYAAGKLNEAKTFPRAIDLNLVTELVSRAGPVNPGIRQNLAALKERNIDVPLQRAIEEGLMNITDDTQRLRHKLFKVGQYIDHMYFHGMAFKIWLNIAHRY